MPARLPRWQMILYASGSLATALSYQAFATYIQFLYIDILGLAAARVGLIWSFYGVWNAVNDPLVGFWSDSTHTRWGRRIPWIAATFLPLSLAFYLLWVPPAGFIAGRGRSLLLYLLIFVIIFDLLWTIVAMNWTALFPEMIPEERQRATVSAWRQIFSLIGLLVGVALPPILAGEDWSGRGPMAVLMAVVTALFFGLSLLGSRERREFQHDAPLPFRDAIRATFTNRDFLYFLGANLMVQFVFTALTATTPFYTKYVLRIQSDLTLGSLTLDVATQNSIFLGLTFIVALPMMPLWTRLAQRWGAWKALRACCLTAAATLITFFWSYNFYTGLASAVTFGLSLAGLLMLTDLLIADIVDSDELKTGTRREGLYFGMNGFIIRFAFTIQGLLTGAILAYTGYVAAAGTVLYPEQPAAAIAGIRWMIAGIPALALLLAFVSLSGYRLRGSRLSVLREDISRLHAQKQAALKNQSQD